MFKFRPHHLICNLCFQGSGYSTEFVENFTLINKTLLANPDIKCIQIVDGIDDICLQCPKNKANKCEDELNTLSIDNSYYMLLQLSRDEIFSLNEVKIKIKEKLFMDDFRRICGQCSWKGLCEPNIKIALFG